MFDLAQDYLSDGESANKSQLLKRKAEWAQKINEPRAAAEMYWAAGEKVRALQIMGENQWTDMYVLNFLNILFVVSSRANIEL